ncbi:hypothetical protein AC93_3972 [Escherichia coli 2-005-03_S4_C2]|uniref:Transposase n=1 Tax=Escherichia coli O81 (strain ED1a) TaxID=585397 RepID=B7MZ01_ECO81|nr:hypothetical protein AC93_3972 [Escherichia coli 2-005-03_S4_C2]CAR09318.1 hypothetical protein ECED1_3304 [Escherichia coli ED1a]
MRWLHVSHLRYELRDFRSLITDLVEIANAKLRWLTECKFTFWPYPLIFQQTSILS